MDVFSTKWWQMNDQDLKLSVFFVRRLTLLVTRNLLWMDGRVVEIFSLETPRSLGQGASTHLMDSGEGDTSDVEMACRKTMA